jgi:hypothetical protein
MAQRESIDTAHAKRVIRAIDSIKQTENMQDAIVWKREHNETRWSDEFLFDSTSHQFFKSEFLTRTIQLNGPRTRIDTMLERISFYQESSNFVAVVFRKYLNGKLLDSLLVFLDCQNGKVNSIHPYSNKSLLNEEDIRSWALAAWLEEEWFKG